MEKPQKITDLVENIDSYIQITRDLPREEAMAPLIFWEDYVKETIRNLNKDDVENKNLIIKITDTLYRKAVTFSIIDLYTNGFIAIVLHRLFWELSQKGARIFYVVDNSMPDNSLRCILEQLPPAGFTVITPHIADKIEYKPTNTQTDSLSYEEVEKKIKEALEFGKNIIYVERDSSVNYLDKVVELARNASDEYAKIFRNTGAESPDILKIEEISKIVVK